MTVVEDGWTPLFDSLAEKVSAEGRRRLLFQLIGDVFDVTVLNLGPEGIARPDQWAALTEKYAQEKHGGDRTPTLILSGELKEGFRTEINTEFATLTNIVDYATEHQFGEPYRNLPARPFYPVDENGLTFTPYMTERLHTIIDAHFAT
jgi:phage gpG-like protein